MNRYEIIANCFEEKIKAGRLMPGDKLPSVRELSLQEKVSPTTVVESYRLLEERGMIESKDRAGFFVMNQDSLFSSPKTSVETEVIEDPLSVGVDELIFALRQTAHAPKILPLGAAIPDPLFFPYKTINRCLNYVLRQEPTLTAEYQFPPGSKNLRTEIAKRYRKLGVDLDSSHVVTTCGTIEAIHIALRKFTRPGDAVLLESPTYFGVLQTVRTLGLCVLEVPSNPVTGMDPHCFEKAILASKKKVVAAILVPNHSNPLGARIPEDKKKEIVEISLKTGVTLIEDEIYGDLAFNGIRPKPLKAFDKNDAVILCGSYSKTASPSLRVGFIISKQYSKEFSLLRSASASAAAFLAEETLAHYLKGGGYDRYVKKISQEYRTLTVKFATKILNEFPPGTKIAEPCGGYVLWIELPKQIDSRMVQKKALEKGISIAPGPIFSAQQGYHNYLRMNCAIPWGPLIEKGLTTLGKLIQSL